MDHRTFTLHVAVDNFELEIPNQLDYGGQEIKLLSTTPGTGESVATNLLNKFNI